MLSNINRSVFLSCLIAALDVEAARLPSRPKLIDVSKSAPQDAGIPLDSFMSFSFELSSWPDFAGMMHTPSAATSY